MNPWTWNWLRLRWLAAAMVVLSTCVSLSTHAQTLPPGVSDIIRDLGEWRDRTWYMLESARETFATNKARLNHLNLRYIEASATANSLIEQFQLETAAHTPMDPRRYRPTLERVRQRCESFTNEYHLLVNSATVRTRSANTTNAATARGASTSTGSIAQESIELTARTMTIADGLLGLVTKHRRAFRELDAQQRQEVRDLLEQRKWRPLDGGSTGAGASAGNDSSHRRTRSSVGKAGSTE